ncbi:MAG: substrate-binding domain-containing protein [Firmicutes bacterium]|nr:substrate-binding domain-containing protein [Bacillota bacterium]MDY2720592.1 substrate-binding domain-containing protein [Candidatus Faecousia sp.]
MKKLIALILTLAMVACLFVGCGGEAETPDDAGNQTDGSFTIGFPWDTASTDPTWVSIYESVKVAVEAAGGELVTVQTDLTADTLINNITELISRGVDGILFMPASDSMLPTVDAMCAEAGVYWATMFRTISDDDIREQIYASKWFAGGCNEDDEACAANIVKKMADMGVENLCCINIAKGDTSSDLRDKGAAKGVQETGINLLNTTYGITVTTDMTKTINSYIAAYPEMDGILLLGTYCPSALPTIEKALADNGKAGQVIVGRIDFDSTMGDYLAEGSFHVSYGGQQQIDPLMSAVVLVNKVLGTPINEDGPTIIITPYLELTSAEEAAQYTEFFLGSTPIYTKEEISEKMIKKNNSAVTVDYIYDLLESFSVADVVERHS